MQIEDSASILPVFLFLFFEFGLERAYSYLGAEVPYGRLDIRLPNWPKRREIHIEIAAPKH
jgi:hypothetical protein